MKPDRSKIEKLEDINRYINVSSDVMIFILWKKVNEIIEEINK